MDTIEIQLEWETVVVHRPPGEDDGLTVQVEQLVERNPEMCAQGPDLIKRDPLFSSDPPVGAVIAYVQQLGDLVHERQVRGQIILDVLKK